MKLSSLSTLIVATAMLALPAFAADNAGGATTSEASKPAAATQTKTTAESTKTKTHKHRRHCAKKSGAKCTK